MFFALINSGESSLKSNDKKVKSFIIHVTFSLSLSLLSLSLSLSLPLSQLTFIPYLPSLSPSLFLSYLLFLLHFLNRKQTGAPLTQAFSAHMWKRSWFRTGLSLKFSLSLPLLLSLSLKYSSLLISLSLILPLLLSFLPSLLSSSSPSLTGSPCDCLRSLGVKAIFRSWEKTQIYKDWRKLPFLSVGVNAVVCVSYEDVCIFLCVSDRPVCECESVYVFVCEREREGESDTYERSLTTPYVKTEVLVSESSGKVRVCIREERERGWDKGQSNKFI